MFDQNALSQINPKDFKGILPVHMRQNIPPYLQILFAARPPLPFVTPNKIPHKISINTFFDGTDYESLKKQIDKNKQIRNEEMNKLQIKNTKKYNKPKSAEEKESIWFEKMSKHQNSLLQKYKEWKEENKNKDISGDPYKTLIISNLVVLKGL